MGSSASKTAKTAAGPTIRRYPTRSPNQHHPTTRPPPVSRMPAPMHPPKPRPAQASRTKTPAIDLDARDPAFASRLNSLGPVQPNPHYSPTSTSQFDPQRKVSYDFLEPDIMTAPPKSMFPDPGNNPAVRLLQARQRIQEEAEEELGAVGRRGFQGRKYVDAGLIQLAMMRQQRGEPQERIERSLGIKKGRLSLLGKGIVETGQ